MWFVDILLVIVGLAAVVVSFKITEKKEGAAEGDDSVRINQIWSPAEERTVKERLDYIINEKIDDAAVETEDRLSTVTNEKIMAVSEMSDQVLHKIDKNHSDIVFLYNMLNEKENEIKEVVHLLDKRMAGARNQAEKERAFVATLKKIRMAQGDMVKDADMEIGESPEKESTLFVEKDSGKGNIPVMEEVSETEENWAIEKPEPIPAVGRQAAGIIERRNATASLRPNRAVKEGKKKTALEMIAGDPEGKEKISPTERYRKLSVSELMELTPDEMETSVVQEEPESSTEKTFAEATKDASAKEAPASGIAVMEALVKEKSANRMSAEEADAEPADEATVNKLDETSVNEAPVDEMPIDEVSAEDIPTWKEKSVYYQTEQPQQEASTVEPGNQNQKIMELYEEGKSILEISKMLEIGQGEVKFVINLSQLTR